MNGACDEFLAGAALTMDKHPAVCGAREHDLLFKRLDLLALTYYLMTPLNAPFERLVLLAQTGLFEPMLDNQRKVVQLRRLLDEIVSAHLRGLHRRLDCAVARNHDNRHVRPHLLEPSERLDAVHIWHGDVKQSERRLRLMKQVYPFFA